MSEVNQGILTNFVKKQNYKKTQIDGLVLNLNPDQVDDLIQKLKGVAAGKEGKLFLSVYEFESKAGNPYNCSFINVEEGEDASKFQRGGGRQSASGGRGSGRGEAAAYAGRSAGGRGGHSNSRR